MKHDSYRKDIKNNQKKFKVVNVVQDFNTGGIQKLLLEYLRYFKDSPDIDYKVVVLEQNRHSLFDEIAQKEDLNIDYLDCSISKNKHYYIRKISDHLCYNGRLSKYLRREKPDVVHTHNSRIFVRIIACIRKNINRYKWFHTLHSDPYAVNDNHIPFIKELLCGEQPKVSPICLNKTQFERAKDRYGLEKCDYLYNVFDFSKFSCDTEDKNDIRKEIGISPRAYVVGTVGRLDPVKNYGLLIKAFSVVVKKRPESVLVFVGDGDEKEMLMAESERLGIAEKVMFLGIRSDTNRMYRMFDLFVSTSITESSGLVLLEAQHCGLKCVVSTGCPVESICTENVVRMTKDASIDEWAGQIAHPSGFAERQSAFDDYSIENNAEKMLRIYKK